MLRIRTSQRVRGVVATIAILAALGLATVSRVGASSPTTIAGLVDVNTNLGYENAAAEGTGMIVTAGGDVVTNNHVIEGATTIKVRDVATNKTYRAAIVGYDVSADVAVLRLKSASGLHVAPFANSSSVKVGAPVAAMGNALGKGGAPTVVTGKVTALDQAITASDSATGTSEQLSGMIETNAAIQPGDSGGALVNAAGQVIGMITAGSTDFEFQGATSEGFAIPTNTVLALATKMRDGDFGGAVHSSKTAFLGIYVSPSGYVGAGTFHFGMMIQGVVPGSPAEKIGLVTGDVITSLNQKSVTSPTAITNILLALSPGAKISVAWVNQRDVSVTKTVVLASGPPQ